VAHSRKAVVVNDDGIDSPGLVALAAAAVRAGLDVVVPAPTRQSSGASAGIIATAQDGQTLVERRALADLPDVEAYAVDAQPGTSCSRRYAAGWIRHRTRSCPV
jgi:5'-nucleotidase